MSNTRKTGARAAATEDARMRVDLARADQEGRGDRTVTADAPRRTADVMSEEELRQMIRSEFTQEALPTVHAPSGWHYCWLSKSSPYDTLHKRMRLGYEPVPYNELVANGQENFDQYKVSGGDLDGCVACNEMVLFKLPMERYQLIMSEFHHNMPMEEERAIRERAEAGAAGVPNEDSQGRKLVELDPEADGMKTLGTGPQRAPTFQ